MAAEILAGGESSRLYQSLVYEQQIAQQASFDADLNEDLGLLTVRMVLASGKSPAEAEKALGEQLSGILKDGVTPEELEKAKSRFLTARLIERETNNGKASSLGPKRRWLTEIRIGSTPTSPGSRRWTTEQVKEVMNRYLATTKKVVIEYLPEAIDRRSAAKEDYEVLDESSSYDVPQRTCSTQVGAARRATS